MKEMIQKNKGTLICTVFVMLVGILIGYTCENSIWVNGTFLVTYLVAMAATFYDNRNRQQSTKVIRMVLWIVPGMTLLYNGIARWVVMDVTKEDLLLAVLYAGTGLLFVIVGNYLPKVKPNRTIGIRVVWALQDEENWHATHRFSGKIWVAAGLLCMICGLFGDSMAALLLFIAAIAAAAFGSILYSYLYYKKKLRTGKGLEVHYNQKVVIVYVIIMLGCVLLTVWTLYTGNIEIRYGENAVTVEAEGWQDYTVKYADIDSITYEENMSRDADTIRTNGFGNLKYSMGHFRDAIHGDYICYTYNDCDTYVVMTVDGGFVIINGTDDAQTREIYDNIRERIGK